LQPRFFVKVFHFSSQGNVRNRQIKRKPSSQKDREQDRRREGGKERERERDRKGEREREKTKLCGGTATLPF
jgi:hypothetical protein